MKYKIFIEKVRTKLFPSEHDKLLKKWYQDNGEENFRLNYPDLNEESVVFDLGGYKGQWASDIYAKYNCNIYIFEPVKSFAHQISERFLKNNKIKVFDFALGASNHQDIISLSNDGSSTLKNNRNAQIESISFIDIEHFLIEHSISNIDLIKINIEGGEYELLPKIISSGIINKINNLQIQFHDIQVNSQTKMLNIQQEINKSHKLSYEYKFVWENWTKK